MATDIWTIKAALDWTVGYLEGKGISNPRLSAEWLMAEATGLSRIELYVNFDKPLSLSEREVLRGYVARRATGEPLQLISGKAPFRYLTIKVAPGVLIPRPETEVLVSEALRELQLPRVADHVLTHEEGEEVVSADLPPIRVLDVCTGSGCIACAIASEYPAAQVIALDIADEAVKLAKENTEELGLQDRVEVRKSDLLEAVDLSEYGSLDLVRILFKEALLALKPKGVIALELFEGHLEQAADLCQKAGFTDVRIVKDLTDRPRVLIGHAPQ